jgi:predicted DNA-binding protein (UPF0251 family)
MGDCEAWVLFGDVIGSRKARVEAAAWLRSLVAELDEWYGDQKLAPFGFTQGDEVQGLLQATADPLVAILHTALGEGSRLPVRWACVRGAVDPGDGPATQRTGPAFDAARAAITAARTARERLVIRTGRTDADELLDGMAPAMVELLVTLTARQRVVARLALIEGLRQSEIAERLKVRRATISVSFARARVTPLARLASAIRRTCVIAVECDHPPGEGGGAIAPSEMSGGARRDTATE